MVPLLVAALLAAPLSGAAFGREARPVPWELQWLQRGDDLQVSVAETRTVNGCRCQSGCELSGRLNCNAQAFCTVGEDCAERQTHLGGDDYDWCSFVDNTVNTSVDERFESLVAKLKEDRTSHAFYGGLGVFLGVLGESVIHTMEMESDVFPYEREKFVRPVGVVAPVKFESAGNHPFTGVFKGSDLGIIRLSLSLQPSGGNGFAPGVALKFLREGRPSANFVGFTSFTGQSCSETNFFEHSMYTHVPSASGLSQLVPLKFTQASFCHQMVGLSDAAEEFDGTTPVFPFMVTFQGQPVVDFPCDDLDAAWGNLGQLAKGTVLMKLYAQGEPGGETVDIGNITLQDTLITSKFGDEQLFFRHQRMEEDFALRPEWLEKIDKSRECGTSAVTTEPPSPTDGCTNMSAYYLGLVVVILITLLGCLCVNCCRFACSLFAKEEDLAARSTELSEHLEGQG